LPIAWPHLIPFVLLLLALTGVVVHDILSPPPTNGTGKGDVESQALLGLGFDYVAPGAVREKDIVHDNMNFGVVKLDPGLGKISDPPRLTYGRRGHTNSTLLLVDGKEKVFGHKVGGRWFELPKDIPGGHGGKSCVYEFDSDRLFVTQQVSIVPGEPVETAPQQYTRFLDTCLVKYKIENRDKKAHLVGFRFLLDTYIADNDGVPFTLPGVKALVSTMRDFKNRNDVPDFIQVLQRPDLKKPGLIMQLSLHITDKLRPPDRVSLTQHPGEEPKFKDHWDVPMRDIGTDSAVVMYWQPEQLGAGKARELGFTYGLGNVSVGETALVGLTVGGSTYKGGVLTIVALIADPEAKDIKIELPAALKLLDGSPEVQPVPTPERNRDGTVQPSPVTWRVRALNSGDFNIVVTTNPSGRPSVTQSRKIKIGVQSLF
jgi:hypothetical protein